MKANDLANDENKIDSPNDRNHFHSSITVIKFFNIDHKIHLNSSFLQVRTLSPCFPKVGGCCSHSL